MPHATASPCVQPVKPVALSSAWPKVWPRFRTARIPFSRGSSCDDAALDGKAATDHLLHDGRFAGQNPLPRCLQEAEELRVPDQGGLDDLGKPGEVLPLRKALQGAGAITMRCAG